MQHRIVKYSHCFYRIQTEENVAESQWNHQKHPWWNSIQGTNPLWKDSSSGTRLDSSYCYWQTCLWWSGNILKWLILSKMMSQSCNNTKLWIQFTIAKIISSFAAFERKINVLSKDCSNICFLSRSGLFYAQQEYESSLLYTMCVIKTTCINVLHKFLCINV